MKRVICFLLAVFMFLFLLGCGGGDDYVVEIVDSTEDRVLAPRLCVDGLDEPWCPDMSSGVATYSFTPSLDSKKDSKGGSKGGSKKDSNFGNILELYFYPDGISSEELILLVSNKGGDIKLDVTDDVVLVSGDAVLGHRVSRSIINKSSGGVDLELTVYDLTDKRSPGVDIKMSGFGWWSPDLSSGESSRIYSGLLPGNVYEVYIYPDGHNSRDAIEMMVVMVSGDSGGTLNVKIYDKKVNVWGTVSLLSYTEGNEFEFRRGGGF